MSHFTQTLDVTSLSFEEAMQQLEEIVSGLERGNIPLDQAIAVYENGEKLKRHCEMLLKKAEVKIEQVKLDREGNAESLSTFLEDA